ncbi:MAG: 2-oxo-4-hydroxy-4-carboxy-5-ureidoimidazoline decarboxylase [Undibacterium sp.]|nr:2-oxo-4-hydroxy-4-carboxy-5-ureidoimidazoline decarboxylase [Opitutaceae bacterium]
MPTLALLNTLDRAAFTAVIGHLFEHTPWVADETWPRRPFRDTAHLHAALCMTMRAATSGRHLALIRAHPDLAGRLVQQNALTAESSREQASAGLDRLSAAELAHFQQLNIAYLARFGFPFVICARLSAKSAILAAMQARLTNTVELEFTTALGEIEKIARLRLNDLIEKSS